VRRGGKRGRGDRAQNRERSIVAETFLVERSERSLSHDFPLRRRIARSSTGTR